MIKEFQSCWGYVEESRGLTICAHVGMVGVPYGIKTGGNVYVSPLIYSLFESDFDQMVKALVVHEWENDKPTGFLFKLRPHPLDGLRAAPV